MKPSDTFFVLAILLSVGRVAPVAADSDVPPSYEEARRASWILTSKFTEKLAEGDANQWPGTHAWLKDLREQTKGIGEDTPAAKWPKVDIEKLVDHNPNFWRMYFEIAPGDPGFTLFHSGLLLSQGEAMRAGYILELGQHRPGVPKAMIQSLQMLQNTAIAAMKPSNAVTDEGTKLFDRKDYSAAIKKYREAHTLCPTNGWTFYELGYTLRTKDQVARGEALGKPGTVKVNGELNDPPNATAAFTEARRHDPLQIMAYQGKDPDVIKGYMAIAGKVTPAWAKLREDGITKEVEYHALQDLSEGLGEAGVHDLAILARQLMVARRNSYDPSDFPIIAASLRKLAPGAAIEEILARLAGKEPLAFRPLTTLEHEDGQPEFGSGGRVFMPEKPAPKSDANKPVRIDHIQLLTPDDDITKRTTAEDISKFLLSFGKIAEETLGKYETPCKVVVQFACTPSGHTVKIMHQPEKIDEKPLQEMHAALAKLDKLPVKEQTVKFQVQLIITPKNKLPDPAK